MFKLKIKSSMPKSKEHSSFNELCKFPSLYSKKSSLSFGSSIFSNRKHRKRKLW